MKRGFRFRPTSGNSANNSSNASSSNNKRNSRRQQSKDNNLNLNYRSHETKGDDDATTSTSATSPIIMKKSNETLEEAYQRVKREQFQSIKASDPHASPTGSDHLDHGGRLSRATTAEQNTKEEQNHLLHPNRRNAEAHNDVKALSPAAELHDSAPTIMNDTIANNTTCEGESITNNETDDVPLSDVSTSSTPDPLSQQQGPRRAMSNASIKKDESKLRKIFIRLTTGILMVTTFVSTMYCGHIYLCSLVFFIEVMLFKELLTVRYNTFFHIIEETIPLFRTTQWMWFVTAIFYTYGDFVVEMIKSNTSLHYLLAYAQYQTGFAFLLYAATFVVSIITMHKDHIRFQINQLCWTILVLCLTVGQLKYIMHNIYNGLIWCTLPIMLVVANDSFAWLAGVTCGKKFIRKPLNKLSPNKSWEGFLGGWIGTMIFGWYLSGFLIKFTWMTCPTNNFSLFPEPLECDLDPVFLEAKHIIPSQVFEVIPRPLVHLLPGVVDVCMVDGNVEDLTACISGAESHTHHHFELVLKNFYPIQLHTLGLSLFASFVAPFGGFAASAIKRAYGLKDFGSCFPGHGGVMDRMDCQFLMALCTWVHYNTFVKMATVSVPKMIYMFQNLNDAEKKAFLEKIVGDSVQNVRGQCQVALD